MKVAVSSTGQELGSQVDPRFEHSPYFIFVDTKTMKSEVVANPNVNAMGGAGIKTAQFVANEAIEIVLTGSCGQNAFQTLQAAGVQLITGVAGVVEEAVRKFKSGEYKRRSNRNITFPYGTSYHRPFPGGIRTSNDLRQDRRGSGFGAFQRSTGIPQEFSRISANEELQILRQQADSIEQELEAINRRIEDIEAKIERQSRTE
jgi:predicted Fe-Mo cluster-binding NifX family protein